MGANYVRLFKLLLDKRLRKGEFCRLAGISDNTLAKLGRGECVTTDVLVKICAALECDFVDIMEMDYANAERSKALGNDAGQRRQQGLR